MSFRTVKKWKKYPSPLFAKGINNVCGYEWYIQSLLTFSTAEVIYEQGNESKEPGKPNERYHFRLSHTKCCIFPSLSASAGNRCLRFCTNYSMYCGSCFYCCDCVCLIFCVDVRCSNRCIFPNSSQPHSENISHAFTRNEICRMQKCIPVLLYICTPIPHTKTSYTHPMPPAVFSIPWAESCYE